jgi:hypothetical protein
MSDYYSDDSIRLMFPEFMQKYDDIERSLAEMCVALDMKPCSIIKCSIKFSERRFWKKLKAVRKGNGDSYAVYEIIIIIIYFFF